MKVWQKIILIIIFAIVILFNLIFMPVGLPYALIPIIIDSIIVIGITIFAIWACVKVGADSERKKDE